MEWGRERARESVTGLPGIVKRANLVGIERNSVSFLVTMIGAIRSHVGREAGDYEKCENEKTRGVVHCSLFLRSSR